jgi:uncharacterized protein involved in copper resistance
MSLAGAPGPELKKKLARCIDHFILLLDRNIDGKTETWKDDTLVARACKPAWGIVNHLRADTVTGSPWWATP